MNVARCWWALLGLCLAWANVCPAQDAPGPVPGITPPAPPLPLDAGAPAQGPATSPSVPGTLLTTPSGPAPYIRRPGPITMALDEKGFPLATGEPYSLFSPFEVYIRTGSSVVIGDGVMDNAIDAGLAVEGGIRSYGYNGARTAAWTCELGLDYAFNNSSTDDIVLVRGGLSSVSRFGQTLQLPTISRYALLQLHRTALRATAGREWYFGIEDQEGVQYSLGVDFGGRLGWATAKLRAVSRDIFGFQQGLDTLPEFLDGHTGDQIKGLLGGLNATVLIPYHGYEWTVGVRIEYRRDWFHILEDDSVEAIQYMMAFGVRF